MDETIDYISILEGAFRENLDTFMETMEKMTKCRDSLDSTLNEIPAIANEVVTKIKYIDDLIDEINEKTWIGRDVRDIQNSFQEESAAYLQSARDLSGSCKEAEIWLNRIRKMLDTITKGITVVD